MQTSYVIFALSYIWLKKAGFCLVSQFKNLQLHILAFPELLTIVLNYKIIEQKICIWNSHFITIYYTIPPPDIKVSQPILLFWFHYVRATPINKCLISLIS